MRIVVHDNRVIYFSKNGKKKNCHQSKMKKWSSLFIHSRKEYVLRIR